MATASPARLITMLYDRLLLGLDRSVAVFETGDDPGSAHAELVRGQLILDELRFSLNHEAGGEIATNLRDLYDYCYEILVKANVEKSGDGLATVRQIIGELREAWYEGVEQAVGAPS
ncbi:MAG: flagellar export chaperone FliS [Actinomycetia bacterium]|nr:flagellar export chaperone FliS [Actinomycetes bacterium]MCP4960876.1 flagellar export chaperone FliS [Actinomycetes bacterium]